MPIFSTNPRLSTQEWLTDESDCHSCHGKGTARPVHLGATDVPSGLLAAVGAVQPLRLALHVHLPLLLKTILLFSSLQGGVFTEAQLILQLRP